jgi:uncharacterized protein
MPIFRLLPFLLFLSACVTVNVYFPAEAAESAARVFTRDVYGEPDGAPAAPGDAAPAPAPAEPARGTEPQSLLDWIITPASAQEPNLDLSSPAIEALKSAMSARYPGLAAYYQSGAIGIGGDGMLKLRDPAAVPLAGRNELNALLGQENRQREELYREIAAANDHPEWEPQIRAIWARQWIANAPGGTWFENGGQWQQK